MAVSGKSLLELFLSAFAGTMDYLKERKDEEKLTVDRQISLTASDETSLLVDFLNDLVASAHIEREVYRQINFKKLTATELEAELKGLPVTSFDHDIKAITYHEADIKKEGDLLKTNVVFDI